MAIRCEAKPVQEVTFAILSGSERFPPRGNIFSNGHVNSTTTVPAQRNPYEIRPSVPLVTRVKNGFTDGVKAI